MAARGGADIEVIFDVLGYKHLPGLDAMDLPGAVTLTFLLFTPYADVLARSALREGARTRLH